MCGETRPTERRRSRLTDSIAVVVISIWAVSILTAAFTQSYHPPVLLHFCLLAVVGGIFGSDLLERQIKKKNGD